MVNQIEEIERRIASILVRVPETTGSVYIGRDYTVNNLRRDLQAFLGESANSNGGKQMEENLAKDLEAAMLPEMHLEEPWMVQRIRQLEKENENLRNNIKAVNELLDKNLKSRLML